MLSWLGASNCLPFFEGTGIEFVICVTVLIGSIAVLSIKKLRNLFF